MADGDTLYGNEKTLQEELRQSLRQSRRRQLMKDVLYGTILGATLSVAALYAVPKIIKNQFYSNQKQNLEKVELASARAEYSAICAENRAQIIAARIAYENDPVRIAERKAYKAERTERLEEMRKENEAFQVKSKLERFARRIHWHAAEAARDARIHHEVQQERLYEKVLSYFRGESERRMTPKLGKLGLADYPAPFVVNGVFEGILVVGSGNASDNLSLR